MYFAGFRVFVEPFSIVTVAFFFQYDFVRQSNLVPGVL